MDHVDCRIQELAPVLPLDLSDEISYAPPPGFAPKVETPSQANEISRPKRNGGRCVVKQPPKTESRLLATAKYRLNQSRKLLVDTRDENRLEDYMARMSMYTTRKEVLQRATIIDERRAHFLEMREGRKVIAKHRQFQKSPKWVNEAPFSYLDLYNEVHQIGHAIVLGRRFNERTFWLDVSHASTDEMLRVLHANVGSNSCGDPSRFCASIRRSLVRYKHLMNYQKRLPLYQALDAYVLSERHRDRRAQHSAKYLLEEQASVYEEQWNMVDLNPIVDRIDGFKDIAVSMRDRLFQTLDGVEGFSKNLYAKVTKEFQECLEEEVPEMMAKFLTHLCICIRQLYTAPTILDQVLAVYTFGAQYATLTTIAAAIWKYLIALIQLINDWRTCDDDSDDSYYGGQMHATDFYREEGVDVFQKLSEEGIFEVSSSAEFAALLAQTGKYAANANSIIRFVESFYRFIQYLMERYKFGKDPKSVFEERYPKIAAWVQDVQDILECGGVPELAKSVSLSIKTAGLYNRGVTLAQEFHASKPPPQTVKIFGLMLAEAQKLSLAAASASQGLRIPPVVIWLQGPPGCGKTQSIQAIIKALCTKLGIEDSHAQLFQRPSTSDYWNGYCSQLAMLIDDFAQSNAIDDRRKQALDLLYAASTCPYILDMADVGSKGNYSFTSRLLFITTNTLSFEQSGLTCEKALERRIDIRATVAARPEFAIVGADGKPTTRVDTAKLSQRLGYHCDYNAHAVEYHAKLGDQTVCPTDDNIMSFTTFVNTIEEQMNTKMRMYKQAVSNGAFAPLREGDSSFGLNTTPDYSQLYAEAALFDSARALNPIPGLEEQACSINDASLVYLASRSLLEESGPKILIPYAALAFKEMCTKLYDSVAFWVSGHAKEIGVGLGITVVIAPLIYMFMKRNKKPSPDRVLESGETTSVGRRATRRMRHESGETTSVGRRAPRQYKRESGTTHSVGARGARVQNSAPQRYRQVTVTESKNDPADFFMDTPYAANLPDEREEVPASAIKTHVVHVEQDCSDRAAQQLIDTRIYQQLFFFNVFNNKKELIAGSHCLALAYRAFWIPYHTTRRRDEWHTIQLVGCTDHTIPVSNLRFVAEDPSTDCCIVEFDKLSGVQNCVDLRKHFATSSDLTRDLSDCVLVSKRFVRSQVQSVVQMVDVTPRCMSGELLKTGQPIQVLDTYFYPRARTQKGDCGSPLILMNRFAEGKILGFHYLGITGENGGHASVVSREYVLALTKNISTNAPVYAELQGVTPCHDLDAYNAEGFEILGTVEPHMGIFDVGRSNIVKSPFFECFGPSRQMPAMLRRTGDIDPLALAQMKNFGPTFSMEAPVLAEILDYTTFWLRGLQGSRVLRLLTQREALNGIVDDPYCEPMNMKTSPGYPWRNLRKGKKGVWVTFDEDNHVLAIDPQLQQAIDQRIAAARQGVITPTIWIDTLKDERRPIEKVQLGKTRLFMNGPFDFTVVFRIYFGSFISMMMHLHLQFECALGVNPHSREWELLLMRLNEVMGSNYIAGDFSNYDGSILAQLVQAVTKLVNDLYDDGAENARIREVLMADIYNAIHIDNRTLYKVFRGNPSGNPLTTVMNSLVNTFLMLYAWKSVGYTLDQYATFVRATNFGDDNLLKVHPAASRFDMRSIAAALRPLGITYTPATKNGVEYAYIPLSEVTFLKRGFVRNTNGIVAAPLDPISRDEMLYWYRDGNDLKETFRALASSHMIEAVHYGADFYHERAVTLSRLLAKAGVIMPELSKPYLLWIAEWYDDAGGIQTLRAPKEESFTPKQLISYGVFAENARRYRVDCERARLPEAQWKPWYDQLIQRSHGVAPLTKAKMRELLYVEQGIDDESLADISDFPDMWSDDSTIEDRAACLANTRLLRKCDYLYTGLHLYQDGNFPDYPRMVDGALRDKCVGERWDDYVFVIKYESDFPIEYWTSTAYAEDLIDMIGRAIDARYARNLYFIT